MASVLVTGCAGFIGSHITEAYLAHGHSVRGVDVLTDYYPVERKRRNLDVLRQHEHFEFVEHDLADGCSELLDGIDVVLHQAGQPGVRASWREHFADYLHRNVHATQQLLEAALQHQTARVVYASSSSVYGNATTMPLDESMPTVPYSPYGVTKLAAENLCRLYAANFGLPVVSLRYFTVYGPRQRPDMAIQRLIEAAVADTPFRLFGSGHQARDFTFVEDVVRANVAAAQADIAPGTVINISGGSQCSMLELIDAVGACAGRPVRIEHAGAQHGDVDRTEASSELAERHLQWAPQVSLADGLRRQLAWYLDTGRHR